MLLVVLGICVPIVQIHVQRPRPFVKPPKQLAKRPLRMDPLAAKMSRLKNQFPPWLWEVCNKVLQNERYQQERGPSRIDILRFNVNALSYVFHQTDRQRMNLGPYPPRPSVDSPLPSSASVNALRTLLDDAKENVEEYEECNIVFGGICRSRRFFGCSCRLHDHQFYFR